MSTSHPTTQNLDQMPSSRFPITVVVLAKNESNDIARCLESVNWCDEIVVIDDFSDDETVEIAIRNGARVLQHRFESFARQRNWAIQSANLRHEWVLMLDADEAMTLDMRREIESALPEVEDDVVAFKTCRKTIFLGKWLRYSDGFPVWIVRLVRANQFQFQDAGHGEVPVPDVQGRLATLVQPFLHFPFSKGISHWIDRHNRYSTLEAQREICESPDFSWSRLWSRDRAKRRRSLRALSRSLPCRSLARFIYQAILKGGILDGWPGLTFSWLMAVYEGFIVLKRRELLQGQRDYR